ncbi:nucleophile aminohydrolase [Phakopsora pachyrhizi]|uniref:Nucleophile aminohydrolase n=1 Tax=Phakopsora pachyrhizi TaxID=170000 RepID=A0AAV0AEC7_PHAPC|nr:nucleophile aminohydrolase [Phakopsora pachyrhizi]CAH7665746.1 nucleophile aminohydrolase [Phakopsora pachyrhizi]
MEEAANIGIVQATGPCLLLVMNKALRESREKIEELKQILDRDGLDKEKREGRLFQVGYAIKAIKLGSTVIEATTKHGVVLDVERRSQSKLLEASSIEKIMEIYSHVGCAVSGLVADSCTMVKHA